MIKVLDKFQEGDFNSRFTIDTTNELTPVKTAFNNMADRILLNIDRLTKSEKDRKEFITNISHDLRTPLALARGYIETLIIKKDKNQLKNDEQEIYIHITLNKIQQVEAMVNQLFELAKMDSAEFIANKEPFVLSEIVQEIVNTFQLKAKEKNISLQ